MILKIIRLLTLCVFISGITHAQLGKVYSTPEYSIRYPSDWSVDSSKKFSSAIMFKSPLDSAKDNFDESVNVLEQDLSKQKMDLDGYKTLSEEQMTRMQGQIRITKSVVEKTPAGGQYFMEYTWSLNGNDYHFKAICRIKDDVAYLVTLSTKVETFDRYNALGMQMFDSFIVK